VKGNRIEHKIVDAPPLTTIVCSMPLAFLQGAMSGCAAGGAQGEAQQMWLEVSAFAQCTPQVPTGGKGVENMVVDALPRNTRPVRIGIPIYQYAGRPQASLRRKAKRIEHMIADALEADKAMHNNPEDQGMFIYQSAHCILQDGKEIEHMLVGALLEDKAMLTTERKGQDRKETQHIPLPISYSNAHFRVAPRRKAKGIEHMIVDALLEADKAMHFSDRIRKAADFVTLDDSILKGIENFHLYNPGCASCHVCSVQLPATAVIYLAAQSPV